MSSGRQDIASISLFKASRQFHKELKKDPPEPSDENSDSGESEDNDENEAVPETAYQYTSLPDAGNYIRILDLQPGRRNEAIVCTLSEVSLTKSFNHYEALSYVWGEDQELVAIQVNDGRLEVGHSLHCALRFLRHRKETRSLWVDAICIDQSNFPERERQVPLMCEIYRNASSTVCFLGPEIATTGAMFAMLENLAEESKTIARNSALDGTSPASNNNMVALRGKSKLFDVYFGDITIVDIATRDWWHRAWTVQELMLTRNAVMMIGKHTITYDNLSAAVDHGLQMRIWTHIFLGFIVNPVIVPYISMRALQNRRASSPGSPAVDLLRLLVHCRHRESRDPRDKIYSVLGILRDTHPEVLNSGVRDTPIVEVGYKKDVQEVYRNMSQELISKTGTLDVLGICPPSNLLGLPSWATDWSSTERIGAPLTQDALGRTRATHATRHTKAHARFSADGSRLLLRGFEVSTIAELSDILPIPALINVAGSKVSIAYAKSIRLQLLDLVNLWLEIKTPPDPPLEFNSTTANSESGPAKMSIRLARYTHSTTSFLWRLCLKTPLFTIFAFQLTKTLFWACVLQYRFLVQDGHAIMEVFYALLAWEHFSCLQKPTNPYQDDVSPEEIYWHTLCCGTYIHPSPSTTDIAKTHAIYTHWHTLLSPFFTFLRRFQWLTNFSPWLGIAMYLRATWDEYGGFWEYLEASRLRRMGRLENGLLGMLPRDARVGDMVVLVRGGGVPLVVRRVEGEEEGKGDRYRDQKGNGKGKRRVRFVGEAYVYGIMDGEVWDQEMCGDIEIE
ncbi:hypothetical protein VTL71DRAFT_5539 [Oculimacula yallundae]|uniref:Heterokaryon incompatibility domain-containing protein n=1 Tax=Oculimacula yallundae TaxID=86028 RepID=A0ABR4C1G9_9HELO